MGMPNSDRIDTHQSSSSDSKSEKILPKTKIIQKNLNAESQKKVVH